MTIRDRFFTLPEILLIYAVWGVAQNGHRSGTEFGIFVDTEWTQKLALFGVLGGMCVWDIWGVGGYVHPGGVSGGMCGVVCGGALGGSAKVGFSDPRKWGIFRTLRKWYFWGGVEKWVFGGISEKGICGPPGK